MNSSGWWAWAIEPGPQITVGEAALLELAGLGLVGDDVPAVVAGQRARQRLGRAVGSARSRAASIRVSKRDRRRRGGSRRIAASQPRGLGQDARAPAGDALVGQAADLAGEAAVARGDVVRGAALRSVPTWSVV